MFQDSTLLPWKNVLENILFPIRSYGRPRSEYIDRARALIEMVGLCRIRGQASARAVGRYASASAICRALIYDPDILLMDEPFSALDAITRDEMNDALLDIWQRYTKTALFVTHSIREAVLLADRVLVMTNRPSTIIEDVTIPFVRPRTNEISETPEFMQICSYLRNLIQQGHGRRRQNPGTRATIRKSRVVQGAGR